jgi:hypothetical protein
LGYIVEVSEDDGNRRVIVDGLHRVTTARDDGHKTITVIRITGTAVPVISLPVEWDEVHRLNTVPLQSEKRKLRFEELQDIIWWLHKHIERFAQGIDVPEGVDPVRYAATYLWNAYGSRLPFLEKLQWVVR